MRFWGASVFWTFDRASVAWRVRMQAGASLAFCRAAEEIRRASAAHVLADGGVDVGETHEAGGEVGGEGGSRDERAQADPDKKGLHSTNTFTLAARPAASMTVSVE